MFNCADFKTGTEALSKFSNLFVPTYELKKYNKPFIQTGNAYYREECVLEECIDIFKKLRQEWYAIQSIILSECKSTHLKIESSREIIYTSFEAICKCLQIVDCVYHKEKYAIELHKCLKMLSNGVLPYSKFSEDVRIKIADSSMKNDKCPLYQYFHTYLDVQYFLIVAGYLGVLKEDMLEARIKFVLNDFMYIWTLNFKRHYLKQGSFICSCMKQFCLLMQVVCEKCYSNNELFWNVFNDIMEKKDPLCALWILRDFSFLQCINSTFEDQGNLCERIRPNYMFLESKIKEVLTDASSTTVADALKLIEPVVCNVWMNYARIEVYQTIWDFFSKRLNISNKNITLNSANECKKLMDKIRWCPEDCTGDFEIFVGMLTRHLLQHQSHWGKIKGRLYSQLGPNKVKELSTVGTVHVMILFIGLCDVNFEEVSKKLVSIMDNLPQEKKSSEIIWHFYACFILKHISDGHSIEKASAPILEMLHQASCDSRHFKLIKDFIDDYKVIIECSDNLSLHQWLLLDLWFCKYTTTCYIQDLNKTLEVIQLILEKIADSDYWLLWEPKFKTLVYPNVKQLALSHLAPPVLGNIAGRISILIPSLTNDVFAYFNGDNISPKVSLEFLKVVLKSSSVILPPQDEIIVQSWVRICFLTSDSNEELKNEVIKLDIFPEALRYHLSTSDDPVYAIIEYLSSDLKQNIRCDKILRFCDLCFSNIDKWLPRYLGQLENEAVVLRIYTYISLAFLNCGSLLYNRNKTSSPVTRLVQVLLLPTDFLIGKKQPALPVLNAVKKTWHLFFEALVKLNSTTDMFLERTLKDLVTKYVPYFSSSELPFLRCLENENVAHSFLEKICLAFFKYPIKESDANVLKALKIVCDCVQNTTSLSLLKTVINKTLCGLFDVVISHSQKNAGINVLRAITSSALFPQVRKEFCDCLLTVTERNLAFNTVNYFQLLTILVRFISADIGCILDDIKKHVANVERKRGVGYDKTLRMHLEKLEKCLK